MKSRRTRRAASPETSSGFSKFFGSLLTQGDLSRLGRNYVETSNYIERVFPFFHVRFLAVTDDFDSFREGVDLTVPLKNIINEFYSKDLAKKSSSAKKTYEEKENLPVPGNPMDIGNQNRTSTSW